MSEPRIKTTATIKDWQFEHTLQFRNKRHAEAITRGASGHLKNAEGLSGDLVGLILRDGPAFAREHAQAFLPSFEAGVPLIVAFYGEEATSPLVDVGITVLLFESLGIDCGTAAANFRPFMIRVNPEIFSLRGFHWAWVLFSLCIDESKAWRGPAGLKPAEALPSVEPGQVFEFNTQGFLRYLAAAIEQRVPVEAVLPAYRDYLKNFPTLRQAHEATFETLFCIAVLVHHRIGGHPITDVPALLHQDHLANVED